MTLFYLLFFFAKDSTRTTYEKSMSRIQNLEFHCWTDTSLFITTITWLKAATSGRVNRRGKICGWSRFAMQCQTDQDTRRHCLSFDVTLTCKNSIICRESNISAYFNITGISSRVTSYVSKTVNLKHNSTNTYKVANHIGNTCCKNNFF
jgi:hypothetical protein